MMLRSESYDTYFHSIVIGISHLVFYLSPMSTRFFLWYGRQGLTYANGVLYESAGLYGQSTVRILDPDTAKVKKTVDMDPKLFAEGMAYINDELVQITWKSHRGFVYDPETLDIKREFKFFSTKNEG